ncbi:MAG TPA: WXG100 family type VII secretion target [Clostridia bacterium]|jgi:WXG100 family type VII secretion target|nr:WXG100 family type VII secretion target [Clostridia bacterium]HPY43389.1 WXG100 family type VII secretion target [Clostridia bacterium]HQA96598.1 WXG100 family type VII secretion target [Clostridia bacterium]HQO54916.1 WXG100 family type VII secretion target [Clostridia bacterium]HUM60222.1 WXG100 family type VII secretion target [Clostridia bacterium]
MAIRMSVQEAESLSTYLKTKSGELLSTMKALDSKLHQGVEAAWEGAAKEAYLARYNEMKNTLTQEFPQVIADLGSQLLQAAKNFEELDRQMSGG